MIEFPVTPAKRAELEARMAALGVLESDLDEQFTHSGGHGGQNVNKVATCVILTHRPTGLAVRCQEERNQGLNRFKARQRLCDLIDEEINGVRSKKSIEIEKARKRKANRRRRSTAKAAGH